MTQPTFDTKNLKTGVLEDYLECLVCKKNKSRFDAFYDLQLSIRDMSSLEQALKKYVERKLLIDQRKFGCPKIQNLLLVTLFSEQNKRKYS